MSVDKHPGWRTGKGLVQSSGRLWIAGRSVITLKVSEFGMGAGLIGLLSSLHMQK